MNSVYVVGDANNCSAIAVLNPDERVYCSMWRNLTESDFMSSVFTLSATEVQGLPRGVKPLQAFSPVTAQFTNPNVSSALLAVTVSANTTIVTAARQTVGYTITLVGG